MKQAPTGLVSSATRVSLECFMSIASSLDVFLPLVFLSLSQSTSLESSLLFTPYELEIKSNWLVQFFERARTRVSGRLRAGVLVTFPIRKFVFRS